MSNPYCEALGIAVPSVEQAARSRDANSYSLLIAVLLERGSPVTLDQAAQRMAAAGVGEVDWLLESLKRCRPARPPIHRQGELYELDPYHDEAELWAFRLGLRPPKIPPFRALEPEADRLPLPGPEEPLTLDELAEAWRRYIPAGFSAQRLAVSVLDAHRRPMKPEDVVAHVQSRTTWRALSAEAGRNWGHKTPVRVREDGLWELRPDHDAVRSARCAVRKLIEAERRSGYRQPDRAALDAQQQRREKEKAARAEEFERLRRVLIHAFPADRPEAIVLVDVNRHQIETLLAAQMGQVGQRLTDYDAIAGLDVRHVLRTIHFEPRARRLHELGPPQKTRKLNRRGRTLAITTEMLIRGSCGISRPFGGKAVLLAHLRGGQETKFRRRLEADAKALFALYQYGRLHHSVRLRWGFLDEPLPAPWAHHDERSLFDLMRQAMKSGRRMEIVLGSAPGWENPWSRASLATVRQDPGGWRHRLFDTDDRWIPEPEVQAARLVAPGPNDRPCPDPGIRGDGPT